jgi:5-methylcytosine-specific restriction endonuclease McrA
MKYTLNNYHHNIPDKVLLDDLRVAAESIGKLKLSQAEYELEGTFNSATLRRRFGSWNNALQKAGLKITKPASKDELLNNLKHVWDTLKRQPLIIDMVKPLSEYSHEIYARNFGSWRRALEAFVSIHAKPGGKPYPPLTKTSAARPRRIKRKKKLAKSITKSMRYDIFKRDKFRCVICGRSPASHPGITLHVDHIIPVSKGGETTYENTRTLCDDCNYGKAAKSDH